MTTTGSFLVTSYTNWSLKNKTNKRVKEIRTDFCNFFLPSPHNINVVWFLYFFFFVIVEKMKNNSRIMLWRRQKNGRTRFFKTKHYQIQESYQVVIIKEYVQAFQIWKRERERESKKKKGSHCICASL